MGFIEQLKTVTKDEVLLNQPMKNKISYHTGGYAKYYLEVTSLKSLSEVINLAKENGVKYFILGGGNNVLFSDNGFDGLVISLKKLNTVKLLGNKIIASAGASINALLDFACENNLSGLEEFSGIPGSVGGAVYMNAGALNKSFSAVIQEVWSIKNGKIIKRDKNQCGFGYRKSVFTTNKEVIVFAVFSLSPSNKNDIKNRYIENLKKRNAYYIKGYSCGSVFINPKNLCAGKLIEQVGLKGVSIGGANVSNLHGNFIVNDGTATAQDIYKLINLCKEKVYQKFGIQLKEELKLIGDF